MIVTGVLSWSPLTHIFLTKFWFLVIHSQVRYGSVWSVYSLFESDALSWDQRLTTEWTSWDQSTPQLSLSNSGWNELLLPVDYNCSFIMLMIMRGMHPMNAIHRWWSTIQGKCCIFFFHLQFCSVSQFCDCLLQQRCAASCLQPSANLQSRWDCDESHQGMHCCLLFD